MGYTKKEKQVLHNIEDYLKKINDLREENNMVGKNGIKFYQSKLAKERVKFDRMVSERKSYNRTDLENKIMELEEEIDQIKGSGFGCELSRKMKRLDLEKYREYLGLLES